MGNLYPATRPEPGETHRVCVTCGTSKPLTRFKKTKSGRKHVSCRTCTERRYGLSLDLARAYGVDRRDVAPAAVGEVAR